MIAREDVAWFRKYARALLFLASEERENPFRPGSLCYPVLPDGSGCYRDPFISDYYNALETRLVPLAQARTTIAEYFIPQYALGWMRAGVRDASGDAFERYGIDGDIWDSEGIHRYPFRPDEPQKEGWSEESPQFLVKNCHEYWRQSGDISLFEENHEVVQQYLLGHPRPFIRDNGIVHFEEADVLDEAFRKRGYGFFDTILLSGYVCFPTLLYWEAYRQIAELFGRIGEFERQSHFLSIAETVRQHFLEVFWDERSQLLLAATGMNRQPAIWDSAYAVCTGILADGVADRISASLARNYSTVVFQGQVRQMIEPDGWRRVFRTHREVNRYQNGAYWGTASGWVFRAIGRTDPALAERMANDLIAFYRREGAYECVYPDGYRKCLHYVASVGTMLRALMEEGYLDVEHSEAVI